MRTYQIIGLVVAGAEIAQLVFAERVVGVKAIRAGGDPFGVWQPPAWYERVWLTLIAIILVYPVALLAVPEARIFALAMIGLTFLGYTIRRQSGLRFSLVVLTLEGALRIGAIIQVVFFANAGWL